MSEPEHILAEAAKLFDALRRQMAGPRPAADDVWGRATVEEPEHPTACRYCPICRAIAASGKAGPGVTEHLVAAGRSLFATLGEVLEAADQPPTGRPRTRPPGGWPASGETIDIG